MAEHRIVVPGVVGSTPIIHPIFCADKHKPPQRYRKVDAVFLYPGNPGKVNFVHSLLTEPKSFLARISILVTR
ncbi:MAG TPA: hypothetical protein PKL34_07970, partial [Candidatus Cloacimonadota bacterium]|nr:hypothetical protein [Candidatus Cloacimonadota bacterium]